MSRSLLAPCMLLTFSACTIHQRVAPVSEAVSAGAEVCIIEDPAVRPGFLEEYRKVLAERGYTVTVLPYEAAITACPVVSTYQARWSWDLAMYMSVARITVFHLGEIAGEAVYDSTEGVYRLGKFVDAETKIRELVLQLFPDRKPPP